MFDCYREGWRYGLRLNFVGIVYKRLSDESDELRTQCCGSSYLTSSSGLAVQAQDLKALIFFNLEIGERDLLLL